MRVKRDYVDHGCGFPVVIEKVKVHRVLGEEVADINYLDFEERVLEGLAHKETRLTGNQVRFVRQYFGLSMGAFGAHFGVSHPAVKKWEERGNAGTNMAWSTEKDLRMWILVKLGWCAEDIVGLYGSLDTELRPHDDKPFVIQMAPSQLASA